MTNDDDLLIRERDWWRELAVSLYKKLNDRKDHDADLPPRAVFQPVRSKPRPPTTW